MAIETSFLHRLVSGFCLKGFFLCISPHLDHQNYFVALIVLVSVKYNLHYIDRCAITLFGMALTR
jgi:hypothetical protein